MRPKPSNPSGSKISMIKRENGPSAWWDRGRHADRRPFLAARGRIKSAIRAWFEAQGFTEVEPGCLQVSPGNEPHLHAFKTQLVGSDLARRDLYLHTSPEFAMKKLLAAGEDKIFAFAPAFRNRERSALHAPEFTMLEWYRTGASYEGLWEDCAQILQVAAAQTGRAQWSWRSRACDVMKPYDWLSVYDAFDRYAGIPLEHTVHGAGVDRGALAAFAEQRGYRVSDDDTWSDIFSKVLTEAIEPELGKFRPEILCEYPVQEAALARPHPAHANIAERFELYVCGVELANGFGELTDAAEQRRRFESWMDDKEAIYGERYPIDEDFLAALAHMPPASGCALGFDRLVMLAAGAMHIDQVLWTPMPDLGK